jgi:creatinine amidohydrolase
MLALAPDRVRRDRMAGLAERPVEKAVRATILDPGVSWPWSSGDSRIAHRGVIGDPAEASAEHGKLIVERVLAAAHAALQQLLRDFA